MLLDSFVAGIQLELKGASVTRFKILYVEDHADIAEVFAALLRPWGHTVTVANSLARPILPGVLPLRSSVL
jgi:hypothetical protein